MTLLITGIPSLTAAESINIQQIIVGPQAGDKPTNFSLKIVLKNNTAHTINDWQFGFYMPRSFRKTSQRNLKLAMQVCERNSKNCTTLNYLKTPFRENDLSTVFTTILAPSTQFPLKPGKNYTLSLLHNVSSGPQHYSALPQSFFLTTSNKTYILKTTPATYRITNYNVIDVENKIKDHLQQNWLNSSLEESNSSVSIIPSPVQVNLESGENAKFILNQKTMTIHDLSNNSKEQNQLWVNALIHDLKLKVTLDNQNSDDGIILQTISNKELQNPEGYQLAITKNQIIVKASNPAGFFYALQTLRQLWYQQTALSAMTINDYPRFNYRGMLLDVARHYFTIDELKNFIDIMASAKLNTLHLHLADDEAFRLNLDNYPQLSKVGATRGLGQLIGPMAMQQNNLSQAQEELPTAATPYSGSYNESDISKLVHYANLRQITIIPEIDIPGHSRALMKALPDSFYEDNDTSEYGGYGDNSIPVCAYGSSSNLGQKFTQDLNNILSQTAQLFNNQTTLYATNNEISIGGDEVFKSTWDNAPSCQIAPWNKMTSLEKEHYFLNLLNNNALTNKLHLSGWQEFVIDKTGKINKEHGIKANEAGHVWVWGNHLDLINQAVHLADSDYPVVLDYSDSVYFDMTYTPDFKEPGFYWATKFGDTNAALKSAGYASLTQSKTIKPENILGIEGALWADVIPNYRQLQYMALPKLAGLAEASWSDVTQTTTTNGNTNWQSLARRLGCGQNGYLNYLHETYGAYYRGYPNGIELETPMLCK